MVALSLVFGCASPRLPHDLQVAQAHEHAHEMSQALSAYAEIRIGCEKSGLRHTHDDCGAAAFREADLLELVGQRQQAEAAFLRAAKIASDPSRAARALVRASILRYALDWPQQAAALCWQTVDKFPDEQAADDALALAIKHNTESASVLGARLDILFNRHRDRDIADNLLYARAELAQQSDLRTAVVLYDLLASSYRRSALWDDSLWHAANLLRQQRDYVGAMRRLQKILDSRRETWVTGSYNSIYLDDAQLLIGRIALEDLHDVPRAIAAFSALESDYPESTLRDDGLVYWARALLSQHVPPTEEDRNGACAKLHRLFAKYPDGNQVHAGQALAAEIGCR